MSRCLWLTGLALLVLVASPAYAWSLFGASETNHDASNGERPKPNVPPNVPPSSPSPGPSEPDCPLKKLLVPAVAKCGESLRVQVKAGRHTEANTIVQLCSAPAQCHPCELERERPKDHDNGVKSMTYQCPVPETASGTWTVISSISPSSPSRDASPSPCSLTSDVRIQCRRKECPQAEVKLEDAKVTCKTPFRVSLKLDRSCGLDIKKALICPIQRVRLNDPSSVRGGFRPDEANDEHDCRPCSLTGGPRFSGSDIEYAQCEALVGGDHEIKVVYQVDGVEKTCAAQKRVSVECKASQCPQAQLKIKEKLECKNAFDVGLKLPRVCDFEIHSAKICPLRVRPTRGVPSEDEDDDECAPCQLPHGSMFYGKDEEYARCVANKSGRYRVVLEYSADGSEKRCKAHKQIEIKCKESECPRAHLKIKERLECRNPFDVTLKLPNVCDFEIHGAKICPLRTRPTRNADLNEASFNDDSFDDSSLNGASLTRNDPPNDGGDDYDESECRSCQPSSAPKFFGKDEESVPCVAPQGGDYLVLLQYSADGYKKRCTTAKRIHVGCAPKECPIGRLILQDQDFGCGEPFKVKLKLDRTCSFDIIDAQVCPVAVRRDSSCYPCTFGGASSRQTGERDETKITCATNTTGANMVYVRYRTEGVEEACLVSYPLQMNCSAPPQVPYPPPSPVPYPPPASVPYPPPSPVPNPPPSPVPYPPPSTPNPPPSPVPYPPPSPVPYPPPSSVPNPPPSPVPYPPPSTPNPPPSPVPYPPPSTPNPPPSPVPYPPPSTPVPNPNPPSSPIPVSPPSPVPNPPPSPVPYPPPSAPNPPSAPVPYHPPSTPIPVSPPSPVPYPPPAVNPPSANPPTFVGCNSGDVRFALIGDTHVCGQNFVVHLSTVYPSSHCPLSSGGLKVCHSSPEVCIWCNNQLTHPNGTIEFNCPSQSYNGYQVITNTYRYGVLDGTIATAGQFTGCTPSAPVPVSPPSPVPHPPPAVNPPSTNPPSYTGCSSGDVRFALIGDTHVCGQNFVVHLSTIYPSSDCPLSSGGLKVCHSSPEVCIWCNNQLTHPNGTIEFNCPSQSYNGYQVITNTYRYGVLDGTIATAGQFTGCTPSPPTNPPSVSPPTHPPSAGSNPPAPTHPTSPLK